MGRQIVYCEGCGNSLREDDFDRGKARLIDNRPFCTVCRPYAQGEEPPRRHSSQKVPAPPRKNATERLPIVNPPPRRPAPEKPSNPLLIIAAVGGIVLLLLIFAVTRSGGPPPAPPPEKPSTPLVIDPPKPRTSGEPTPAPPPPPPPPPPIRRDPPTSSKTSDPLVAPSASEKLDAFITQIKQLIQEDVRRERSTEILNMFTAAARSAGARSAEVAKLKQDYLDTLDENTRRAALWSEWKIFSSSEPGSTGLLASHGDRTSVMMTHPADRNTPARIERDVEIPSGRKTTLGFWVCPHQQGDFELRVFVDGREVLKEIVGPKGSGWQEKKVDLSLHAGKKVAVRLENVPNNWEWEHAYWHDLKVTYE